MLELVREGQSDLFWALFMTLWRIEQRGLHQAEIAKAAHKSRSWVRQTLTGARVDLDRLEVIDDAITKLTNRS